jgi:hypothetical protein
MIRIISALACFLFFSGCATTRPLHPDNTAPVCDALVGPIRYNSQVRTSRRFAGPDLAKDLAVRNRVGTKLGCSKYRL